tara:strand:+ start:156 stop:512 length:357 start_codon:yes stop_codon:yes gene_type:complete
VIDLPQYNKAFLDKWGETIYYLPDADSTTTAGAGREILAVVDRNPKAIVPEAGTMMGDVLHVTVANADSGDYPGVTAVELNTGRDVFVLEKKEGDAVSQVRINRIARQDDGMLTVECR